MLDYIAPILAAILSVHSGTSHSSSSSEDTQSSSTIFSSSVESSSSSSSDQTNLSSSLSSNSSSQSTSSSTITSSESSHSSSSIASENLRVTSVAVEDEIPTDWYIRLRAKDPTRNLKTRSSMLGQLKDINAVKKHGLKSLTPFSSSFLDIVFVNPDGLEADEYQSNFHVYEANQTDSWKFTVKTDDVNSNLIISWSKLHVLKAYVDKYNRTRYNGRISYRNILLNRMQVVDEETGEILPVAVNGHSTSFIINMNGENRRTFRWELLTTDTNATISDDTLQQDSLASRFIRKLSQPKRPMFDLSKPPKFIEVQ